MRMNYKKICTLVLPGICVFLLAGSARAQSHRAPVTPPIQRATVLVTEQGYSRTSITLRRGVPARITFLRQTENTCGTEIVIAAYGINRPLPLNQRVVIGFTPKKTGEIVFACGMGMMRGKLIVL